MMSFGPNEIVATMVAVSFAAGLNLPAAIATLGLLGRFNLVTLPAPIALLSNEWVIGVSLGLFVLEFFADKVPVFDLIWNVLQTVIKVPAGALLAWSATTSLSPAGQITVAVAGAVIALAAHGGKLALRGAVTPSPEPFSNVALSLGEDVVAIGLTWFATEHPYLAVGIATMLVALVAFLIRWVWRALKRAFSQSVTSTSASR
jgi:hypothetical protein